MIERWAWLAGRLWLPALAGALILTAALFPWLPREATARAPMTIPHAASLGHEHRDHQHGEGTPDGPSDAHAAGACTCCTLHGGDAAAVEPPAAAEAVAWAALLGMRLTHSVRPESPPPQA
jgi:hypothetical protein